MAIAHDIKVPRYARDDNFVGICAVRRSNKRCHPERSEGPFSFAAGREVPSVLVADDEAGLADFLGRPAVGLHLRAGAVDVVLLEDRGVHESQDDRIGAEIFVAQEDVDELGRHDGTNASP